MNTIKLFFALAMGALTPHFPAQTFTYDFTTGYEGWTGDFADYPVTDSIFYELDFIRTTLPTPLNTSKYALKITGNNHSDDLFMFIKRKLSGLFPNTTYQLLIDVEFASKVPTNAFGVGGAPGEGVTVKAGASILEPVKINSSGFYLMNTNKSNQANPGVDMDTIGHVGVSDTTTVFKLINRNNATHLFTITTDANGEVWVCIGTDSGFEATTTLYYNRVTLTFMSALGLDHFNLSKAVTLYPNPTRESVVVKINPFLHGQVYEIIDQVGSQRLTGKLTSETSIVSIHELPDGMYFFKIVGQNQQPFKIIKQ